MDGCVVLEHGIHVSLSRAKKFHVGDSESDAEGEEVRKFRELYPNLDEEECVFKKPTAKVWCYVGVLKVHVWCCVIMSCCMYTHTGDPAQKPGGNTTEVVAISKNMKTARRKPLASRNGQGRAPEGEKKRSGGAKQVEDFSWFELDSVFGFVPDD